MASNIPNPPTSNCSAPVLVKSSSPPTASDCTTTNTTAGDTLSDSGTSALAEPVLKCLRALESASNDTEKLAALFLVPKLVKGAECDRAARIHIMKGIGFSFLARMLRSKDTPDGCPQLMYQSVALSVLSCFTSEEEIMTNPSVLFNVPVLLGIISDADNKIYEENLLIVNDSYAILTAIASYEKGRSFFISNRGIHYLCEINIKTVFQYEKALHLLLAILNVSGQTCWSYHSGTEDFNNLMLKFCQEFSTSQDESKFEMCHTLKMVIRSFPKSNFDDEPWLQHLQKGLRDIIFSKIGKNQRDPALKLVSTVIETSDFEWCIQDLKFLLIILNLSCIEVIMHLEEQKLEDVLEHSELLVACFSIIESSVSYMANDRLHMLEEKQKSQIYTALKNAFGTILKFINETSIHLKDNVDKLEDAVVRHFICAVIRILAAWLAEETMANREDVYEVLPFVLTLASETFEAQKLQKLHSLPGRGSNDFSNFSKETMIKTQGENLTPDILRFLFPGLCHLVAEEKPRSIILHQLGLHETLYTCLSYHWSVFDSYRNWLNEQAAAEDDVDVAEPLYMIDNAKFEMVSSRYGLSSICNIFMNITVLERDFVKSAPIFFHILKFIMNSLPTLDNSGDTLVLYGNFCVLGLLILQNHSHRPKSTDFASFKFIQAVIRFLWDGYNCDESQNGSEMNVSCQYRESWNDVEELWFLGMQILASLFQPIPWIAEFVMESGWAQDIVKTLDKVSGGKIDDSVKMGYEDILSSLVLATTSSPDFKEELKNLNLIQICQKHKLKDLAGAFSGKSKS